MAMDKETRKLTEAWEQTQTDMMIPEEGTQGKEVWTYALVDETGQIKNTHQKPDYFDYGPMAGWHKWGWQIVKLTGSMK